MEKAFNLDAVEKRKLSFLYSHSGISTRYSVIPDYSLQQTEWAFYPKNNFLDPFPTIEQRMLWYNQFATTLSVDAINDCLKNEWIDTQVTHLITVSCTGMSAPGLDLAIMDILGLPKSTMRSSINFMGCYAAIHALKMADLICKTETGAKVLIVCTELCTLHFQKNPTPDNITSTMLFADGSAAALVVHDNHSHAGIRLNSFYSEVIQKGKTDMAWELSSTGFLMTLSGYIPDLIKENFEDLLSRAMHHAKINKDDISQWCIHPGGKRIIENIQKSLQLKDGACNDSYDILDRYGNMSSATILFVLKQIMKNNNQGKIFGAAFGPGITMETFTAAYA